MNRRERITEEDRRRPETIGIESRISTPRIIYIGRRGRNVLEVECLRSRCTDGDLVYVAIEFVVWTGKANGESNATEAIQPVNDLRIRRCSDVIRQRLYTRSRIPVIVGPPSASQCVPMLPSIQHCVALVWQRGISRCRGLIRWLENQTVVEVAIGV